MGKLQDKDIEKEMIEVLKERHEIDFIKFALSTFGSVPFVGGAIAGAESYWSQKEQAKINSIFHAWLKLQKEELEQISITLSEVLTGLDMTSETVIKRIESKAYMDIVKKCFRDWSAGESEEKRILLKNLLTHAAVISIAADDVIKVFIDWIAKYSELHFKIIGIVYRGSSMTRCQIWNKIYSEKVREDSAEADLFKLIIQDLSMGHVIRQYRMTDNEGNFLKQKTKRNGKNSSRIMKSAFEDHESYVLTDLGKQFVHYTMDEIVPKAVMGQQRQEKNVAF